MSLKSIVKIPSTPPRTLDLGKDDDDRPKKEENTKKEKKAVPPKLVFNEKLDGYDDMRKSKKEEVKLDAFLCEINDVFDYFETDDKKYNFKKLLWVCNQAENYFTKEKSGELKLKAVKLICAPYFNNDDVLLEEAIKSVLPLVKKSSVIRRVYYKTTNFFLSTLCRLKA